jgi:glucose-6-phosphate isomerase
VSRAPEPAAVEARIPASLRAAVARELARAVEENVAERLREGDATLWGPPGTPEIADRLGWLTIAERMLAHVDDLHAFAAQAREEGMRDAVLLGMGGSSLAAEVLRRCRERAPERLPARGEGLRLHVLDSTDAAWIRAVERAIDPRKTLFVVSSKSGGTIEPLSLFAHFWPAARARGESFVAITDPGSGLQELAAEHLFRRVFHGDPEIGGRYSALSPFGLVPGALMGLDVGALLAGAAGAWETEVRVWPESADDILELTTTEPAYTWLGAALSALAQAGRDKLTFLICESLPGLGLWLEQLVAESTGKRGTGILPVAEEPPGDPREYGEDRVFVFVTDERDETFADEALRAHAYAYAEAGHPLITIPTRGPADLGRVFALAELAVAVAGWGLQINPFDQPNVQQAKDATGRVLEQYESSGELPAPPDADEEALAALLGGAAPPGYIALMGYLRPSPALDAAVGELRATLRQASRATTTFGYGPRFLHSTGQFHKGGPKTGRFLQLLHDAGADVDIPGRPYSFATLEHAQAIGDLQTLRELGPPALPAERVTLRGEDPAGALRELTTKIKELL